MNSADFEGMERVIQEATWGCRPDKCAFGPSGLCHQRPTSNQCKCR